MPLVIEEITGELLQERPSEPAAGEPSQRQSDDMHVQRAVRATLHRQRLRARRLSDR